MAPATRKWSISRRVMGSPPCMQFRGSPAVYSDPRTGDKPHRVAQPLKAMGVDSSAGGASGDGIAGLGDGTNSSSGREALVGRGDGDGSAGLWRVGEPGNA